MTQQFEFDLVFALPEGQRDAFVLSDTIYGAGFDDAVVGTGQPGLLAVALDLQGENAVQVILDAAKKILLVLPKGAKLREVRPDLVSLADVAHRLEIKRQALQKRRMPPLAAGGCYRVTEIEAEIREAATKRKARFNVDRAKGWFAAGHGAQRINAFLALGCLNPESLDEETEERMLSGARRSA